jgi:hypothetical protein
MNTKPRLALIALVTLAACSDSSGPDSSSYGRYVLRSVNGRAVPVIYQETATARLEFLSGALRLNQDGTFTDSTEIRVTPMFQGQPLQGGQVVHRFDVAWGLHTVTADTVYLTSTRGEHYFMLINASGSLSQELAGSSLLYRK